MGIRGGGCSDAIEGRLLCVPTSDKEKDLAFPSPAAAGWGNAVFLALCMKLAYEVRPKLYVKAVATAIYICVGVTERG